MFNFCFVISVIYSMQTPYSFLILQRCRGLAAAKSNWLNEDTQGLLLRLKNNLTQFEGQDN